ncbi:MAG: hypothetical protein OEL89_00295 [Candidatus Peregrinibacteria bacterium]|nr:hypothetical protein [Candidatus Peregrinibacteria bacterium]
MEFLNSLMQKYPMINLVLGGLGSLLIIAQIVVVFTPSKKDDEKLADLMGKSWFKKAYDFLVSFAPYNKK